jgi:hypothetical protein
MKFLDYVIEDLGKTYSKELDELTQIKLHHRMLEYMLYN